MIPLGKCPCGKEIFSTEQIRTEKDGPGQPGLVHGWPPCKPFIKMELIEYMKYVRTTRGISDQ